MNNQIKQELAQDLYVVASYLENVSKLSDEMEEFRIAQFSLDDRSGEITLYDLEDIEELVREIEPELKLVNGLYEASAKNRLVKALKNNFSNLEEIYNEKIEKGFTLDEMLNAAKLVGEKFGVDPASLMPGFDR